MAKLKTPEEIALLRESGKRLGAVLGALREAVRPGITTQSLDALAERLIRAGGDTPPFLGYTPRGARMPFPASLCVSTNDEIVHGIPGDRVLAEGDIVGLDLGVTHKGMITDAAITVAVGKASVEDSELIRQTASALEAGIRAARPGGRIGDIAAAIEAVGRKKGYGIVEELGGHGVGHHVHEEPYIPNHGRKGTGPILKPGMVLALEPMFTLGSRHVRLMPDGYTIVTNDGTRAAHFEHTIVITEEGVEVLTR